MCCVGKWFAAFTVATAASVVGFNLYSVTAAEPPKKEAKATDLTALQDAVNVASKRGANVDAIREALDAFAKVAPAAKPNSVPPELQSLRDAVDMAASKGENVDGIAKELEIVEMAVAGKSLAKPKPEPKPDPKPEPKPFPGFPGLPDVPGFQPIPLGGFGGIDVRGFDKAMELRRMAIELMMKNPRDPDAQKMLREANKAMLGAVRGGAGAGAGGIIPFAPLFGDPGRVPDRARLGIRMERVPAVAADQLGLDPNTGLVVSMVMPNSAAEKAGLKVHDIIVQFAGKPVDGNMEDFVRRVVAVKKTEKVDMVVLRKGKKVELKGITLPEADKPAAGLPQLRPNAFFDLPINPAFGRARLPAGFGTVSYSTTDGAFTLKATKGDAHFVLTGTVDADGKPTVTKATVEEGDKTHSAASIAKLPEAFRADAEQLLKAIAPR